jgi:beta-glucosidase
MTPFPPKFYWGASTSSHQVEGHNHNDWTEWENSAERLAFLKSEGLVEEFGLENFLSGMAANHYHLYKEDFKLAKELGHNATRISLEWSRIEPEEGKFDEEELQRYKEVILHLRELGIEPFVTLWHWTIPIWLRNKGGWAHKKVIEYFVRYAEVVIKACGEHVTVWLTLNEPEIYAAHSYLMGTWPPQKKNLWQYFWVLRHLIHAHRLTYTIIKRLHPTAQIGIAKNNIHFEPYKNKLINKFTTKISHWWWNDYFLRAIKKYQDFIGLNYYFRNIMDFTTVKNDNHKVSDLGWELHPEGIYHVLMDLKKYAKPVYITENGLADANDSHRTWFIEQTVWQMRRALENGVDLRGYLHWSLLDNFEWDKGFRARFGLIEVDFKTQERKVRKSAEVYREIIKDNQNIT